MSASQASPLQGRLLIVAAAILWSLSGAFVKSLTQHTALRLGEPPVPGLLIAFYRTLFASLFLLLLLRRRDVSFHPLMAVMVLSFATMNALFISALDLGSAANAIILQYTAPVWIAAASVFWLKEPADRRTTITLAIAMTGVAVIVVDGLREPSGETFRAVLIALASGLAYAGVVVCLRALRGASSRWLTVQNHLCAALVLVPVLWFYPMPRADQLAFLALFGIIQLAVPYWLLSRGLQSVSPQEAAAITLIEPVLNPCWTYLAVGEVPRTATFIGGGLILAALVWRYFPFMGSREKP